jgi:mannose-6-phosphate isomerase-like protein (cupin superfamily)
MDTIFDLTQSVQLNQAYRRVIATTSHSQLVLMTLQPNQEIGLETHDGDQFICIKVGKGIAVLNGNRYELRPGVGILIPEGTEHNIINGPEGPMKLFTLYTPPEHDEATYQEYKGDHVS